MTTANQTANGLDPVVAPLIDFWSRALERNAELTAAMLKQVKEGFDPLALRRRWLDTLAESLDAYMRTPVFLESMRGGLQAVSEHKRTTEDLAQEAAREMGIPRMPDVSGLFERLQIGQEAIQARLRAIEQRLERLENRGAAL